MTPSRRKCGGRASAAAAAAARRQWKVGDLVLAKVKGFPAWPATVSEPEKWGYSSDRKKVLVYFFGTQQIAFCNPADVEEFTKEKKESILTKRHGKGADFVCAVHEIIESYEKLKKQEQAVARAKSGDEFTMMNAGESVGHFALKDQTEAPEMMLSSCVNKSCFTGDKDESSLTVKGIAVATQADVLNDRETSSEEAVDNLAVARKPVEGILSAKRRVGVVRSERSASQEKGPEAPWSRSSLKVNTNKFQKFMLPCTNGSKATRDIAAKVLQDGIGCLRRSKRIGKSLDLSEGNGTDSATSISNGSNEENGSEIVTVDSDTLSPTEGNTLESDCKLLQPESVVECCLRDVELSQMFDFHAKTIVVKKKRKPNRKRMTNDAPETTRLNNMEGLEIDEHRTGHITPNYNEKLNESYCKEDGDEHLPLVKRARVRMGRSSSAGEDLHTNCTSMQSEEKSLDVSNRLSMWLHTSLNCEDDPVDRNSFVMKCGTDNSSLQNKYPQSPVDKSQLWEFNKKQLFAGSMDGEAALPPSKRLHRALEAMSANAAKDGQTRGPSTMKTLINGCYFSPSGDSLDMSMKGKAGNGFEVLNLGIRGGNSSQDGGTFGFSTSSGPAVPKESEKYSTEVAICDGPARSSNSPGAKHDLCNDLHVEGVENCSGTQVVLVSQSPKRLSPDLRPGSLDRKQNSLAQMFPSKEECENEIPELNNCKSEKPVNKLDSSDHSGMSTDNVSEAVRIGKCTRQNITNLLLSCSDGNCSVTAKVGKLPLHVNNQLNGMCEVVKEIKPVQRDSNYTPTPTSVKVIGATTVVPTHIPHCTADSDDLVDKDLSGIRSSSSPTDGLDDRASPPNNIICKSDSNSENNGCCSPDVHLCHVKSQNMAKCSYRPEATVLASFEAVLGTLTRTKESISRATRIAIDCAKFGIAVKVVEILARNLESESSLHRRVDLFFLVDSITQCSRGLKGDVGYIYPSAIQAVLPRILLAAAPPGRSALENRRQCLKVLKLWLERRILPDSIIRHHIRDLETLSCSSSTGAFSQFSHRPLRTERAFDDPIREMEGMNVDEYGSNSSIQLPGFCMPPMLKGENEGSDSDGGSFEAVTPEHNLKAPEERERIPIPVTVEKHRHILEDVDGELEMEDVSPSCEAQVTTTSNVGVNTAHSMQPQFERHLAPPFASPLAKDVPPLCPPPLPSSPPLPPPPPPPPLASLPPSPISVPISDGLDSNLYMGTHNIKDNLDQSMFQQPAAPRMNSVASDAVYYQGPECGDPQMQTWIPNHASSCSFSSLAAPHQQIQQIDYTPFSNKGYHLRPPQSAPSNQFSYVQADQQMKSLREVPTASFPNRAHFGQATDGENLYSDCDRMKLVPHELGDSWRFSRPLHSGAYYPDPARGSNPPAGYAGLPCEPPLPIHRWGFHPRPMNHREFLPHRPPCGGPILVPIRAPSFWQPR